MLTVILIIGVVLIFTTGYPHSASTWPKSQEIVAREHDEPRLGRGAPPAHPRQRYSLLQSARAGARLGRPALKERCAVAPFHYPSEIRSDCVSHFLPLGKADEFSKGKMRAFSIGGREIAVANIDGTFYAFSNICTHQFDYLTNGLLLGRNVVCGFHEATFDLESGAVRDGPAIDPLPVYPLRVAGNELEIDWPEADAVAVPVDADDDEHRLATQFRI